VSRRAGERGRGSCGASVSHAQLAVVLGKAVKLVVAESGRSC
jgi:hypothetical protein